jgi:hypothetical protein
VNHLDPRPRQRDSLADANPPDEETARLAYLQRGAGPHFHPAETFVSSDGEKSKSTVRFVERTSGYAEQGAGTKQTCSMVLNKEKHWPNWTK